MNLKTHHRIARAAGILAFAAALSGCVSFGSPGQGANFQTLVPASIQTSSDTKPANPFPATIITLRVQAPPYDNDNTAGQSGAGSSSYFAIVPREAEEQKQFERMGKLSKVTGIVALNQMQTPTALSNMEMLRAVAIQNRANQAFIYTFNTKFQINSSSKSMAAITLGFSSTKKITAATTASALLVDTRTGFVYTTYEVAEKEEKTANSWNSDEIADQTRQETERRALGKLIDEVVASWPNLLERYSEK